MTSRPLKLTIFPNPQATELSQREMTWPKFIRMLRGLKPRNKKASLLIKLATFTGEPNGTGCLRYDVAVVAVTGIEGDYDAGAVTAEEACERLQHHGLLAVVVTTHSHTADFPRWRVFAPLAVDHAPDDCTRLVAGLNGALGGILAGESFTLSQSYYVGPPPQGEYKVLETSGTVCLDQWPELDHCAIYKDAGRSAPADVSAPVPSAPGALLKELLQGEEVHDNSMRLTGHLVHKGLDDSTIRLFFEPIATVVAEVRSEERARELMGTELQRMIDGARSKGYCEPKVEQSKFEFIRACDMQVNPISWLVNNYFEANTLVVVYGPPGKGKSFVALDVSCCIAAGIDFHGHDVKSGAVFYIAGEGHNGIARRVGAWAQHHGVSKPARLYLSKAPTNLVNATNAARVAEAVQELVNTTGETPKLIVIDTMARNFVGDENSATDVGQFVTNVDNMRRRWDATVLIIHHSGKDSQRGSRGSSALKGAVDAEYELSRDEGTKQIRLSGHKMKDADLPPHLMFEMVQQQVWLNENDVTSSAILRLLNDIELMEPETTGLGKNQLVALENLRRLTNEPPGEDPHAPVHLSSWKSACEEDGVSRNRFHESRKSLIERELIRIEGDAVYLCPAGHSALRVSYRTDIPGDSKIGRLAQEPDIKRTRAGHEQLLDELI